GLAADTRLVAAGDQKEGFGYLGVWATDAAACGTVDQPGGAGYVVITKGTFRDGSAVASYGNFKALADGKVTLNASGGKTVELAQSAADALTVDGKALVRCTP
ncbi:MAG: hypothetical protein ABIQ30_05300, partial [Devosia sp.]